MGFARARRWFGIQITDLRRIPLFSARGARTVSFLLEKEV